MTKEELKEMIRDLTDEELELLKKKILQLIAEREQKHD